MNFGLINFISFGEPLMSEAFCKVISCIKNKDFETALNILKNIEKTSSLSWHQAYLIGFCLKQLGDIPDSIIYYKKSLSILPNHPLTLNAMGISYQNMGNLSQARHHFEESIKLLKVPYFPKWSSYSLMCRTLLSEGLNSLGTVLHLLSEKQTDKPELKQDALRSYLEAVRIEGEVLAFKAKNQTRVKSKSSSVDELKYISVIEKEFIYKSPNLIIFQVNVAAQLYRNGHEQFAKDYIVRVKEQIDEFHPHWHLVIELTRNITLLSHSHSHSWYH